MSCLYMKCLHQTFDENMHLYGLCEDTNCDMYRQRHLYTHLIRRGMEQDEKRIGCVVMKFHLCQQFKFVDNDIIGG